MGTLWETSEKRQLRTQTSFFIDERGGKHLRDTKDSMWSLGNSKKPLKIAQV